MNIGFIGAGNMATAIIKGYISNKGDNDVLAFDLLEEKLDNLKKIGVKPINDVKKLVEMSDFLFLCVKPQNITDVLENIKEHIKKDTVIISIIAGLSQKFIDEKLGYKTKLILVMPNTPILLGEGATALSKTENVKEDEFNFVCNMFSCCGVIQKIPVDKMNEIIAVNGSTPAFIYEFTKYFVEYAKQQGIDENVALDLFCQTLIGSAKMMTKSGYDIDTLIEMVSSKGGTTIEGLKSLRKDNTDFIIKNACEKTIKRAYELAK